MKGWGANMGREGIQALDLRADAVGLSPKEWLFRYDLEDQLSVISTDEEAYWRLRGAQKWFLKGDANTVYFQAIANGRRRRNTIPLLWDGSTLLQSPATLGTMSTVSIGPCSQPLLGAAYLWPVTAGPAAS